MDTTLDDLRALPEIEERKEVKRVYKLLRRIKQKEKRYAFQKQLDYCNQIREELHLEPVDHLYPGRPTDPRQCVIAATIKANSDLKVSVCIYICVEPCNRTPLLNQQAPEYVHDFICMFDTGRLKKKHPELYRS